MAMSAAMSVSVGFSCCGGDVVFVVCVVGAEAIGMKVEMEIEKA